MTYKKIKIPKKGEKISYKKGVLTVPDNPIIPFIEGDGIGVDITPPMINVVNQAVKIAYSGERKIEWMEVYCGEKATQVYDKDTWLPDETIEALKEYVVSIKGPLTTPVGGGIRSLNVSLRQLLDLYVCLRPIRYFDGVPSPVKRPQDVDMVIFRENSEDIYCGVEFEGNSKEAKKLVNTLKNDFEVSKIRFEENVGIGVKPISQAGTTRLVKKAIDYAIANNRTSVTLVHKGNIMKFTEGAFRDWGYEVAKNDYGGVEIDEGPWQEITNPKNGKSLIAEVKSNNQKFSDFYNSVISRRIADDLDLDFNQPLLEIVLISRNSTFIAKKSKTFDEEKNVAEKAPIDGIQINDLSKTKKKEKKTTKEKFSYSIKIADFYYKSTAKMMVSRIKDETSIKNSKIKKLSQTKFRVLIGPFNDIKSLKESFEKLKSLNFENLEVFKNV